MTFKLRPEGWVGVKKKDVFQEEENSKYNQQAAWGFQGPEWNQANKTGSKWSGKKELKISKIMKQKQWWRYGIMELEGILANETSQKEDKHEMLPLTCGI